MNKIFFCGVDWHCANALEKFLNEKHETLTVGGFLIGQTFVDYKILAPIKKFVKKFILPSKRFFKGYPMVSLFDIDKDDIIVVAIPDTEDMYKINPKALEIYNKFINLGYKETHIFSPWAGWVQYHDQKMKNASFYVMYRNAFDLVEKDNPLQTKDFIDNALYLLDYFRHRTFEFVAKEINKANVAGAVAEVGVFRGDFARHINACFANKKLYLFDTFESFNKEEFEKEVEQGRCKEDFFEGFKNTSVDLVLSRMIYPENCVIKQGFFPDTAKDLMDEKYAFVSIDVDFEKSILEGLRYFYPRLEKGGAIFVHDYNNRFLEGVKVAVQTYEEETNCVLQKVPIADQGGTLIILK